MKKAGELLFRLGRAIFIVLGVFFAMAVVYGRMLDRRFTNWLKGAEAARARSVENAESAEKDERLDEAS